MDVDGIAKVAAEVRAWVESRWPAWRAATHPGARDRLPAGMCAETSAMLREVLSPRFPEMSWHVTGGEPDLCVPGSRGGMVPAVHFRTFAHTWVQGDGRGAKVGMSVIVDCTADQFGHEPTIVAPVGDRRYVRTYGLDASPDPASSLCARIGRAWAADFERESRGLAVPGSDVMSRRVVEEVAARRASRLWRPTPPIVSRPGRSGEAR